MSKNPQNFSNHRRVNILHHFFAYGFAVVLGVSGMIYAFSSPENYLTGLLFGLTAFIFCLALLSSRMGALKAQDRAIRAEENFRYYVLTGERYSSALRLGQIIALRFASDEELPALAKRAEAENLTSTEIKKLVKNWRADYHRV